MSLPHALLTSLLEKSSSGYELARRFERSIGYFWKASHQQIYRELGRMEALGWIAAEAGEAAAPGETGAQKETIAPRSRKKVYRVLEAGRLALRAWAGEPSHPAELREDLMIKLRAEAVIGPLGLEREIARRLALHRDKLAEYRAIEARDFSRHPLPRADAVRYLILQCGIRLEEANIGWSEEALAALGGGGG